MLNSINFEKLLALLLLIVISPLFLLISLLILLFSGRPILYRHNRGGYEFKEFQIIKFRTMHNNFGSDLTNYKDPRITLIGAFLRKYKIDELPQLINVIKGEMKFVGPRPESIKIINNYKYYFNYLELSKPGITDINSIIFKNESTIFKKLDIDLYQEEILPIKSHLVNLSLLHNRIIHQHILFIISIIAIFNHNFSLRLVRDYFLTTLEPEFRIKLNRLLSKKIF